MTETLTSGLCFAEGPRWHEGRLWFSDMHGRCVYALDMAGKREAMARLEDDEPSGLGWLPDGRLLVVSMRRRRLLVQEGDGLRDFCDLSGLASHHCNDMVTDGEGRSYIGNFGYDLFGQAEPRTAEIVLATPDGRARLAAKGLDFPNGMVITPDGKTLIVGETMGPRLTAFDRAANGSLSKRRVWAEMQGAVPDGICLDEAGGVWVASPVSREALRILEGGEVTHRVKVQRQAYAVMLGGEDGKTLFVLTSRSSRPDLCVAEKLSAVETAPAPYARAGLP